jgi:FAD-dependent oxidoreductase family protein/putative NAD(P)-binding protein
MRCFLKSILTLLLFAAGCLGAETVLLETEGFENYGGWVLDQQSLPVIGSSYMLAHGLGIPVDNANTTVGIGEAGDYKIWGRTKDWVAQFDATGAPGKFEILIDGKSTGTTLGTKGKDWSWHCAGTVTLPKGKVTIGLKDLTGFEGRCDAIVLSNDPNFQPPEGSELARWRTEKLGLDRVGDKGEFDMVVVGGGVAGCCAAISAARLGLEVALIQDRGVLGGNSSSEIQVHIMGHIYQQPYPVLGEIVDRLNSYPKSSPGKKEWFGDEQKLKLVQAEKNILLFLNEHVDKVLTDGGKIVAVEARNTKTNRRSIFRGRWFVDSTGDGTVGFLAGADFETTQKGHMGNSNMFTHDDTGQGVSFPECPWAVQVGDKDVPKYIKQMGHWNWESGFDRDTIYDAEAIRDNNFRGMYGVFSYLKNHTNLIPNRKLTWAAYVSGRRESRRLLGDIVLTEEEILEQKPFPDASVTTTWTIDLHYPKEKYIPLNPERPFLSYAKHKKLKAPYPIPYRCLYSRNIDNLFMAGRDISVTHEALGTVRVMGTCGMMGEVVGRAASLCKKFDCDPRAVYEKHLAELKSLFKKRLYTDNYESPASKRASKH